MAVTVAPNPGMLRFPYKKAPAGGGHAEEEFGFGGNAPVFGRVLLQNVWYGRPWPES